MQNFFSPDREVATRKTVFSEANSCQSVVSAALSRDTTMIDKLNEKKKLKQMNNLFHVFKFIKTIKKIESKFQFKNLKFTLKQLKKQFPREQNDPSNPQQDNSKLQEMLAASNLKSLVTKKLKTIFWELSKNAGNHTAQLERSKNIFDTPKVTTLQRSSIEPTSKELVLFITRLSDAIRRRTYKDKFQVLNELKIRFVEGTTPPKRPKISLLALPSLKLIFQKNYLRQAHFFLKECQKAGNMDQSQVMILTDMKENCNRLIQALNQIKKKNLYQQFHSIYAVSKFVEQFSSPIRQEDNYFKTTVVFQKKTIKKRVQQEETDLQELSSSGHEKQKNLEEPRLPRDFFSHNMKNKIKEFIKQESIHKRQNSEHSESSIQLNGSKCQSKKKGVELKTLLLGILLFVLGLAIYQVINN